MEARLAILKSKNLQISGWKEVHFVVGNLYHELKQSSHSANGHEIKFKWTMFVQTLNPKEDGPASKYIKSVKYHLDEKIDSNVYKVVQSKKSNPDFNLS